MASSSYVYNQTKNGYGMVTKADKMETITLFNELHVEFTQSLENIIGKCPVEDKGKTIY